MNNGRPLRSLTAFAVAVAFTALLLPLPASAQVAIRINGNDVDVSPTPMIQDGRVFVPLRGVFQDLGARVDYANGQITASGNGRDVALQIGSRNAIVDNTPETIDVAPFIIGESTYVPLRFVSQALGANVAWDNAERVVRITLASAPEYVAQADRGDGDWVDAPPPPIPAYDLPPVPAANDIWIPGYWAWGEAGYYWVPGFWSQPPDTGLLWTPGYWGWNNNAYVWHQGYWGPTVGYYGGINYGAGYYGHGYSGGRWSGNTFAYNTAVTPVVNRTIIRNVYVDRTVIVNNTTTTARTSYNGGKGGLAMRPTPAENAAAHATHKPMTTQQQQHARVAGQDRRGLVTVNAGKPPVVAAPRAYAPAARPAGSVPVTSTDRAAGQKLTPRPAAPAAPVAAAPPAAAPAARSVVAAPVAAAPQAPAHTAYVRHAPPMPQAVTAPAAAPAAARPAVRFTAPVARSVAPPAAQRAPAAAPAAQIPRPAAPAAPQVAPPAAPRAPIVSHPQAPGRVDVRPAPRAS